MQGEIIFFFVGKFDFRLDFSYSTKSTYQLELALMLMALIPARQMVLPVKIDSSLVVKFVFDLLNKSKRL